MCRSEPRCGRALQSFAAGRVAEVATVVRVAKVAAWPVPTTVKVALHGRSSPRPVRRCHSTRRRLSQHTSLAQGLGSASGRTCRPWAWPTRTSLTRCGRDGASSPARRAAPLRSRGVVASGAQDHTSLMACPLASVRSRRSSASCRRITAVHRASNVSRAARDPMCPSSLIPTPRWPMQSTSQRASNSFQAPIR